MLERLFYRRPPRELAAVAGKCPCGNSARAAAVMAALGMTTSGLHDALEDPIGAPDPTELAAVWRTHIDEERRLLFPFLLQSADKEDARADVEAAIERLEVSHALYLALLDAGHPLPVDGPHGTDGHGALEDALVDRYASIVLDAAASASVGRVDFGVDGAPPSGLLFVADAPPFATPSGVALRGVHPHFATSCSYDLGNALPPLDAADVLSRVWASWLAYAAHFHGAPVPGTESFVGALETVRAGMGKSEAQKQAVDAAFLDATAAAFGKQTSDTFKAWIAAWEGLWGKDPHYAPAFLEQAKACATKKLQAGLLVPMIPASEAKSLSPYAIASLYCAPEVDGPRLEALTRWDALFLSQSTTQDGRFLFLYAQPFSVDPSKYDFHDPQFFDCDDAYGGWPTFLAVLAGWTAAQAMGVDPVAVSKATLARVYAELVTVKQHRIDDHTVVWSPVSRVADAPTPFVDNKADAPYGTERWTEESTRKVQADIVRVALEEASKKKSANQQSTLVRYGISGLALLLLRGLP
jgi:hypothetical protein